MKVENEDVNSSRCISLVKKKKEKKKFYAAILASIIFLGNLIMV